MSVTLVRVVGTALLVTVMLAAVISAQGQPYGRIAGMAKDTTGGALAGVTVELRARDSGTPLVTQTDRAGRYQFDAVSPGEFEVAFTLINFATLVRQNVRPKPGQGAEVGLRTVRIPHVQSTISLWRLDLDSELVFVGDAGTTEAGRPSRRVGVEWATYASSRPWLSLDGDLAVSRATFTDSDPAGDRIPGSVESVVSLGASIHEVRRFSGSVRLRFFGPRPLTEDGSVRSHATSLLNAQASYRLGAHSRVVADLFNLLNETASDIDYFYTSRLVGEPLGGVADVHTHPALPRAARVALQVIF